MRRLAGDLPPALGRGAKDQRHRQGQELCRTPFTWHGNTRRTHLSSSKRRRLPSGARLIAAKTVGKVAKSVCLARDQTTPDKAQCFHHTLYSKSFTKKKNAIPSPTSASLGRAGFVSAATRLQLARSGCTMLPMDCWRCFGLDPGCESFGLRCAGPDLAHCARCEAALLDPTIPDGLRIRRQWVGETCTDCIQ